MEHLLDYVKWYILWQKLPVAIRVDGIFYGGSSNPRQALSDADTQLDMASAEKIIQGYYEIVARITKSICSKQ